MSDYQSPSKGQKGDCSITVKRRRIGGKTESLTVRGPCAGGKAHSTAHVWDIVRRTFVKAAKASR